MSEDDDFNMVEEIPALDPANGVGPRTGPASAAGAARAEPSPQPTEAASSYVPSAPPASAVPERQAGRIVDMLA